MNVNNQSKCKFSKVRIRCNVKSQRHSWEMPAFLNNELSGLVLLEVCRHCGAYRKTETDLDYGQTEVTYAGLDMDSDDWVYSLQRYEGLTDESAKVLGEI